MIKCWNCGGQMHQAIGLGQGWFRCDKCGATWTKMPKPGNPAMTLKADPVQGESYSPRQQRKRRQKSGTTNNANAG